MAWFGLILIVSGWLPIASLGLVFFFFQALLGMAWLGSTLFVCLSLVKNSFVWLAIACFGLVAWWESSTKISEFLNKNR